MRQALVAIPMLSILQIIPRLHSGGAESLALTLHREYLKRNLDSHLLSLCGKYEHLPDNGGIYSLNLDSPYSLSAIPQLRNFLTTRFTATNSRTRIVHSHLLPDQIFAPISCKLAHFSGRLVTTVHSTSNRRRSTLIGRFIDKQIYRQYDSICCISDGVQQSFNKWLPELSRKSVVIQNGIDLTRFRTIPRSTNKRLIITTVARLVDTKNHDAVLRALAQLPTLDYEYRIVGDGPLANTLRATSQQLGIDERVVFMGRIDDVRQALADTDLFVLVSKYEGFGLAAVEAMALGIPVIASNVPGLGDVVGQNGEAGLLVGPGNVDALAQAIKTLGSDSRRRALIAISAKQRSERYSIENTVNDYTLIYQGISTRYETERSS